MLKILKNLTKRDILLILCSFAFIVLQVWLDLEMPGYMSEITVLVQTKGSGMNEILSAGGYMLLCALGSFTAACVVGFFAAKIAAGLAMRLREKVFDKTLSFSMEEINGFSTASLITRSTNDISQIQMLMAMGMQVIMKAPVLAIWAITKIAGKSWQWTAVTGAAVVLFVMLLAGIIILALPKVRIIQQLTDNINRVARENLSGIRIVRAYNAERYQEKKFDDANSELTKTNLFVHRIMAVLQPTLHLIMSGLILVIYWVGVYIIDAADMGERLTLFSDMVVFSSYATQVIMAFMLLTMIFVILPRASVSAGRINEILDTDSKILDGTATGAELYERGRVEFRHVSFRYPDAAENVLYDISFTANKGETVAFIGSTGSGKSTLINLIPRFFDATEGEVLIDGVNVKEYTQEALHNKLGFVPQRATLFRGTVSTNVAYGDNGRAKADRHIICRALEIAQAKEFVEKMPHTYEAAIAQGGTNVSGGQRQRLSIARAICRRPEIYIFDDSFSALDYKTDRALRSALKAETKGITSLIVAQRIGTIIDADKIIVLDNGRIVGSGTHGELLENCPVYREIAESQFGEEEIKYAI